MAVVVLGGSLVLPPTVSTLPAVAAAPTTCDGRAATIVGTDGDDRLVGTAGNDVVSAGGGNDVVIALEGADVVCAGSGDDLVAAGDGRDTLHGEDGNDALYGERGTDTCSSGEVAAGCDTIVAGPTPTTTTTTTTTSTTPTTTSTTPTTTSTTPTTTSTTPTTTSTTPTTTSTTTVPPTGESFATVPSNFDTAAWLVSGDRGVPPSTASEPSGSFRMLCGFSHLAYDDPIVYPGQPGASHLHTFFGNALTNAASTYQSMRSAGSGSCQGGPLDRSGYWLPAVHNAAGQVVIPSFFELYYLGSGSQQMIRNIQTMPNGLRMIAGFDMANPNTLRARWECISGQEVASSSANLLPCGSGQQLRVVLRFPMCWNGQAVDSADHRSHMAYGTGGGGFVTSQGGCPSTHPIHLPEFFLFANYVSDGNTQNWYLSSDRMPGMTHANGSTFHADFFGAWDNTVQERFTQACIREMRNCNSGELGDGTQLRNFRGTYNGPSLVDPPPRP